MRRTILLAAAFVTISNAGLSLSLVAHAQSREDNKIEARISAWGRNCKNAVAEKYKARSMADVEISLGATLRASIDAGEVSLADIKRDGLSYNFRVNHAPGKDPEGYCNTDGQGNVNEIRSMRK